MDIINYSKIKKVEADLASHKDVIATKETPAGAQSKANAAENAAKAYTDIHEQKVAPHSGHETPTGAQAKADAAEGNAKSYTDQEVTNVEADLASHKEDYVQHLASEMPHLVRDLDNDKTYRFGLRVKDGNTQLIYEEAI